MFPPSNLKPSGFRPRVFHGSGYDTHTKHLTNQTIAQKSVLRACKTMHWHQSWKKTTENTMWIGDTMPSGPSTFQNDTFDSISRARIFFCLKILGAGVVMVKVHCWWLKQCLDISASWFKANSHGEQSLYGKYSKYMHTIAMPKSLCCCIWSPIFRGHALLNATSSVAMMQMMILMVLIMLVWCFPSLVCILRHQMKHLGVTASNWMFFSCI